MNLEWAIQNWVEQAIDRYKLGVETDYMVSFSWTPSNEGMRLAWNIGLVQASPLLGQRNMQLMLCPEVKPTEEQIGEIVREGLEQLRTLRAKQLQIGNGRPNG